MLDTVSSYILKELLEVLWEIWYPHTFQGNMTFRQLLVKHKGQDLKEKKSGVIYRYKCGEIACDEEYIG